MSEPAKTPPPGFDRLSVAERIEYVQALWDQVSSDPTAVLVPQWHRDVIEERLKRQRTDPEEGTPWPVVRERLERKLRGDEE
jgi:putative addiction module component (TIGR02574 family)